MQTRNKWGERHETQNKETGWVKRMMINELSIWENNLNSKAPNSKWKRIWGHQRRLYKQSFPFFFFLYKPHFITSNSLLINRLVVFGLLCYFFLDVPSQSKHSRLHNSSTSLVLIAVQQRKRVIKSGGNCQTWQKINKEFISNSCFCSRLMPSLQSGPFVLAFKCTVYI